MHFVGPVLRILFRPAVSPHCGLLQLWKQELLSQHADETALTHLSGGSNSKEIGSSLYSGEKKNEYLNGLTIA